MLSWDEYFEKPLKLWLKLMYPNDAINIKLSNWGKSLHICLEKNMMDYWNENRYDSLCMRNLSYRFLLRCLKESLIYFCIFMQHTFNANTESLRIFNFFSYFIYINSFQQSSFYAVQGNFILWPEKNLLLDYGYWFNSYNDYGVFINFI